MNKPLRICSFGTYRAHYGRNKILLAGLAAQGVPVMVCHEPLWQSIGDRVQQVEGGWFRPRFLWRVFRAYWRLWRKHRHLPDYDVMLLGYPGTFDAYLGRFLSRRRRVPMVIDHYMSLYLIAEERGLLAARPFTGKVIRSLESGGLHRADRLLADTAEYIQYHCRLYGLAPDQFALVPAGADETFFYPRPEFLPPEDRFRVVYYGTFIPNHDAPLMVRAAVLLANRPDIQFDFYGEGPDLELCRQIVREAGREQIRFHGWLDKEELPEQVARAHLVLGAFGQTPQSLMTIQNKIWEAAAMARPILSGDSGAVRQAFRPGEEIYLVDRGDPVQLAQAIADLADHPEMCARLARGAYARYQAGNTVTALGEKLVDILSELVATDNTPGIAGNQTRRPVA